MIVSSINLHQVISIELIRVDHGSFVSHQFTFTTEDGAMAEVSAFADVALPVTESERKANQEVESCRSTR